MEQKHESFIDPPHPFLPVTMASLWQCSRNQDFMIWEKGDKAGEERAMDTATLCGAVGAAFIDIIFIIILIVVLASSTKTGSSAASTSGEDQSGKITAAIILGIIIVIVPIVGIIGARWRMRARAADYHSSGLSRAKFFPVAGQFAQAKATSDAGADVGGAILGASMIR